MPASPPPAKEIPRRHYWSLPEALEWRRQRQPDCSHSQALAELCDLLDAGAVRVGAVALAGNPLWPDDRKTAFERANLGALVTLSKAILAEVNFVLYDNRRIGAQDTGSIEWKRSGVLAFSDPRFDRDALITAWLALLDQRRAERPEPVDVDRLYKALVAEDANRTWDEDLAWAKNQKPPVSRRRVARLRKDHGTAGRGRHRKKMPAGD